MTEEPTKESGRAVSDVKEGSDAKRSTVAEKWQGAVTDGSGFVAVPMALLRLQSRYDLTATDMMVLINFLAHWWEPDQVVFPRSTTIAHRMGVTKRTVQRTTHKLERKGLLRRSTDEKGRRVVDFTPLAGRLAKDVTLSFAVQSRETFGDL